MSQRSLQITTATATTEFHKDLGLEKTWDCSSG